MPGFPYQNASLVMERIFAVKAYRIHNSSREILVTDVFLVDIRKLLRVDAAKGLISTTNWPDDLGDGIVGKVALRGEFWMGSIGLEGFLSLLVPIPHRSAREGKFASEKQVFDWWRFLTCVSVPADEYRVELWLSMSSGTDFARSQDVVCRLTNEQLGEQVNQIATYFDPDQSVSDAWDAAWVVFQREFDALRAPERLQIP